MDSYERHEFSDVYPHWVVNDMVADMREHGWDGPPILLYEGKILDGFHRFSAAMIAEVEAVFEEFHGTRIEAARKVYRANLYREMTAGQRAACKIKLMELAGTMLLDQGGNRRSEDFKRNQVPVENVPEPLPVYESIRSASTPVNEEEPRFFTADEMASVTGSVKTDTVMQGSNIPLYKWAIAVFLMNTSLKGVSSMKLHRDLGISQPSAWHLAHRIRKAWETDGGLFGGPVEVDETYIGGKERNKHDSKRLHAGRGAVGKAAVVGMKDRETGKSPLSP